MAAVSERHKIGNRKWDEANLKRFSIALPKELYGKLKAWSTMRKKSVNSLVRELIETNLPEGIQPMEQTKTIEPETRAPITEEEQIPAEFDNMRTMIENLKGEEE